MIFFNPPDFSFSSFIEEFALKIAPDSTISFDMVTSPSTEPVDSTDNKSFTCMVPVKFPAISAELQTIVPLMLPFSPITTFPFVSIDPSKAPSILKSDSETKFPTKVVFFSIVLQPDDKSKCYILL